MKINFQRPDLVYQLISYTGFFLQTQIINISLFRLNTAERRLSELIGTSDSSDNR